MAWVDSSGRILYPIFLCSTATPQYPKSVPGFQLLSGGSPRSQALLCPTNKQTLNRDSPSRIPPASPQHALVQPHELWPSPSVSLMVGAPCLPAFCSTSPSLQRCSRPFSSLHCPCYSICPLLSLPNGPTLFVPHNADCLPDQAAQQRSGLVLCRWLTSGC